MPPFFFNDTATTEIYPLSLRDALPICKAMLTAFGKPFSGFAKSKNAALLALPVRHTPTIKSFQNFGNIAVEEVRNLNPLAILSAKYLVIASPKDAVAMLGKKVK